MIFYYIFLAVFGLFSAIFLSVGVLALIQHRRQPLQQRLEKVRTDLLKQESTTGVSELNAGMYSKVSNEMLRDVAESEGFLFVGKSNRYLSFQRALYQSDGTRTSLGSSSAVGDDFGGKRQMENLLQTLDSTEDPGFLILRRDELGALPKEKILRTAQEHGWAYQTEEISGNEWRLLLHRDSRAAEASQEGTG